MWQWYLEVEALFEWNIMYQWSWNLSEVAVGHVRTQCPHHYTVALCNQSCLSALLASIDHYDFRLLDLWRPPQSSLGLRPIYL